MWRNHKLALAICVILFILPFFWLKPGEMDLGGDSSRLFFYDPLNYLKNSNLYYIAKDGIGLVGTDENYEYAHIPYFALFILLKSLLFSSTTLINFFNGIKLAVGFIAIYLIVREFLLETYGESKKDILNKASILTGVFYTVSQGSINLAVSWGTALPTHNQFFIYPLIFFFLFKSLTGHKYSYLSIALLISFIFSPNFGLQSIPAFFAFWPVTAVFLFLYVKIFGKKSISWKIISTGTVLFLGTHAFHLLALVFSLFDSGSLTNVSVFDKNSPLHEGINMFGAVLWRGMVTLNLLLPSPNIFLRGISFLPALIVLAGFVVNKKKEFLFISIFFFITFFFATANITNVGVEFYKSLFNIPGFSIFRLFFKWLYVFVFFYALLFGFATYSIIEKLKVNYSKYFFIFIFIFLIISGIPLFSGAPINKSVIGGTTIKTTFVMDPKYEQVLEHIRALPDDGKIVVLPLIGFNFQFFFGENGGAYLGLNTISHLTGKYSFTGERHFGITGPNPYSYLVQKYAKEKNYGVLNQIFSLMNIRYILYNADSRQYKQGFSDTQFFLPEFFPKTESGYEEFLGHFAIHKIYKNGSYILYEFDKSSYNSTIFIPKRVYEGNDVIFDEKNLHSIFIDENTCNRKGFREICKGEYKASDSDVSFKMINPALYEVTISQKKPQDTILLVMQHTFHRAWKLVIDKKNVPEESHIIVNRYANGWLLGKGEIPKEEKFTIFIKLDSQKYFWYGWAVTAVSLTIVIALLVVSLVKKQRLAKRDN